MVLSRVQLKTNAKARLSGNWGGAITAMLLPGVISFLIIMVIFMLTINSFATFAYQLSTASAYNPEALLDMIGSLFLFCLLILIAGVFLINPLSYGNEYWHYKLARGLTPTVNDIFYFFTSGSRYKNALLLSINQGIRRFGWSLLANILIVIMAMIGEMSDSEFIITVVDYLGFAVNIAFSYFLNRYSLSFTQMCDNEGITTTEAIRRSITATKPYLKDIFVMGWSFFGWLLLCIFILPLFYVVPYVNQTMAEEARNISDVAFGPMPDPMNVYSGGNYNPNTGNPVDQSGNPVVIQQPVDQFGNPNSPFNAAVTPPPVIEQPIQQYADTSAVNPEFSAPTPEAPQPPVVTDESNITK